MKKFIYLFPIFINLFSGCEFINDIMNMSAPEIVSYHPSTSTISATQVGAVTIEFSKEMEKSKTEAAFTLNDGQDDIDGEFIWQVSSFSFTPYNGFETNKNYSVTITTSAEDLWGNSLLKDFHLSFFTGNEKEKPQVLSHSPQDAEVILDTLTPIVIQFSESVDTESFYNSFSLTPDTTGTFTWNGDNSEVTFNPLSPYTEGEQYTVEIDTILKDLSGNPLAQAAQFFFEVASPPVIQVLSFQAPGTPSIDIEDVGITPINSGIEKDSIFSIQFDNPIPQDQRYNIVQITPASSYDIDWAVDYTSCTISFRDYLKYNQVYQIVLLDKTYRIIIDGQKSIPPVVERIVYVRDSTTPVYQELILNGTISLSPSNAPFFDFYIYHAPGASISLSSFFDALAISVPSNVGSINLLNVINPANLASPAPSPVPGQDVTVIRVNCQITDNGNSGIITFTVDQRLSDSYDNTPESNYTIQVNK